MIQIVQKVVRRHVSAATWREVSQRAWEAVAAFWHEKILPKHFDRGAYREYGYPARSRKHEERKQRRFGHQRPLVFSGKLERQVLRMREVRAQGGTGGVRRAGPAAGSRAEGGVAVKVFGPAYLRPTKAAPGQINFAAEISAFSNRDRKAIAVELDRALRRELRAARSSASDEEVKA